MARYWYAHYLGDYAKKTAHLTMLQTGAYRLLLDHYYATGKPLPANAEQLHVICRAFADAERHACAFVLGEFFELRCGKYHNKRADEELETAAKLSETRRKAAKTRYANAGANAGANAVHLDTQSQSQSQSHLKDNKGGMGGIRKPAKAPPVEFPDWWPNEAFAAFREMRQRIRAPLTAKATVMLINTVHRLRDQGEDPAAVLDQSTQNSYRGVFPTRKEGSNGSRNGQSGTGRGATALDSHLAGISELIADIGAGKVRR